MKIKLNEIGTILSGLYAVQNMDIPRKTSYWLARYMERIKSEIKIIEKERMKLIKKYAEKDKDGNPKLIEGKNNFDISKKNRDAFEKEYAELGEVEIEIDYNPIKLEDLGEKIKPIILFQLRKIITAEKNN